MHLVILHYLMFQILDLLGPKTEADLAPPPKVEKKPKNDGAKKAKKTDEKGKSTN